MKHQPYRRNDGFYSCRICQWKFEAYPNKNNCPGVLRIERANDDYKTENQWNKLGYELVILDGHHYPITDAVSIIHSTNRFLYYHRDHVRKKEPPMQKQ